jgi:hypothetical protein
MFYAVHTAGKSVKKLFKCVDAIVSPRTQPLIYPSGSSSGYNDTTNQRPTLQIDKDLIANIIQIVKKVI